MYRRAYLNAWTLAFATCAGCFNRTESLNLRTSLKVEPQVVDADGISSANVTINVLPVPVSAAWRIVLSSSDPKTTIVQPLGGADANGAFVGQVRSEVAGTVRIGAYLVAASQRLHLPLEGSITFQGSGVDPLNTDSVPSGMLSKLIATPSSIVADGSSHTKLMLSLVNAAGMPLPAQTVSLSATGVSNTITPSFGTTNASGVFTATLASTKAETKLITATAGATYLTSTVTFTGGKASTVSLAAAPSSASANGIAQINLSAAVYDVYNNAVPGCLVTFAASGTKNKFSAVSGATDANGILSSSVTSTIAQAETVTANAASLTQTAAITFTSRSCSYASAKTYAVGSRPTGIFLIDVNRDSILDLITASGNGYNLNVLLGSGNGNFGAAVSTAAGGLFPYGIAGGDYDEDGNIDLVVATTSGFSLFLGYGNGSFRSPANIAVPGTPVENVGVGDFDGDGKLDVMTDGPNMTLGLGDGTFGTTYNSNDMADPYDGVMGDVDGDGNMDIILGDVSGAVGIALGSGGGKLQPVAHYPADNQVEGVRVNDMNQDGKLDIIASSYANGNIDVFFGNGDGTFQPFVSTPCGVKLRGLAVGDVDGDGILDVVGADQTSGGVCTMLGTGNSAAPFYAAVAQPVASQIYSVQVVDLNGDTRGDVAVTSIGNDTATILITSNCAQ